MRATLTRKPLTAPSTRPVAMAAARATQIFTPYTMLSTPITMPERLSMEPTERSMPPPPERMTIVSPIASRPIVTPACTTV